jgi:hypothetical protein
VLSQSASPLPSLHLLTPMGEDWVALSKNKIFSEEPTHINSLHWSILPWLTAIFPYLSAFNHHLTRFFGTGIWTLGFVLAKQVLSYLCHTSRTCRFFFSAIKKIFISVWAWWFLSIIPSSLGGRDWENDGSKPARQKVGRPHLNKQTSCRAPVHQEWGPEFKSWYHQKYY